MNPNVLMVVSALVLMPGPAPAAEPSMATARDVALSAASASLGPRPDLACALRREDLDAPFWEIPGGSKVWEAYEVRQPCPRPAEAMGHVVDTAAPGFTVLVLVDPSTLRAHALRGSRDPEAAYDALVEHAGLALPAHAHASSIYRVHAALIGTEASIVTSSGEAERRMAEVLDATFEPRRAQRAYRAWRAAVRGALPSVQMGTCDPEEPFVVCSWRVHAGALLRERHGIAGDGRVRRLESVQVGPDVLP